MYTTDSLEDEELVYLSGPMTGHLDFMQEFAAAEKKMESQHFKVINPALVGNVLSIADLTREQFLYVDFALLDLCDTIFMMKGWSKSPGAVAEYVYALVADKEILFEDMDEDAVDMSFFREHITIQTKGIENDGTQ